MSRSSYRPRIIPALLLAGSGLVKTRQFDRRTYLGDPLNTVRIFNEKGADELMLLDIDASRQARGPRFELLADIASEAFMPLAYGGGLTSVDHIRKILHLGFEKVVLNTAVAHDVRLVSAAAAAVGSSSVVVSVDVRRSRLGRRHVMTRCGSEKLDIGVEEYVQRVVDAGAGEVLLQSIDRDGTKSGYDLELVERVTSLTNVPVVPLGGAAGVEDLGRAVAAGASAVAAGSMFVFTGKHDAVLISYPTEEKVAAVLPAPRAGRQP